MSDEQMPDQANLGALTQTTIPDTVPELRSLMQLCEQRIHELEWKRLNREECFCDRYTCFRCRALQCHQPFIKGTKDV